MTPAPQVVVVGAGMAGLRCALELQGRGLETLVLEAGDAAGGRVRTDEIDGFLVDRGFQVLLTAYPEARSTFDYGELDAADPTGTQEQPWLYRPDAFSSYRSGFEVRTCRRCDRGHQGNQGHRGSSYRAYRR